jgi:hypothetical protein
MARIRRWWWVLFVVPALVAAGFVLWAESTPRTMPEALEALEANAQIDGVVVTTGNWLVFRPNDVEPTAGLVFYPGGRVDREPMRPPPAPLPPKDILWSSYPCPSIWPSSRRTAPNR